MINTTRHEYYTKFIYFLEDLKEKSERFLLKHPVE